MAGSYKHIVTTNGNLRSNESFVDMIENLGDAYEMTEELYGMIWYLASKHCISHERMKELVEEARKNYLDGLRIAKAVNKL